MARRNAARFFKKYVLFFLLLYVSNFFILWISLKADNAPFSFVLFRASSLITLTGFSPDNFYTTFNDFGIWAYTSLMQMNIIFYWFLVYAFVKDVLNFQFYAVTSYLKVLGFIFVSQLLLFVAFFYSVSGNFTFQSLSQKIHFCWTYSISSLSNFRSGLLGSPSIHYFQDDIFLFHLVLYGGAIVGSLGYFALMDLIHPAILRKRLKDPEIDWKSNTKLALFGSVILLSLSSIIFFVTEYNQYFNGQVLLEKIFNSLFLSLNSRIGEFDLTAVGRLDFLSYALFLALVVIGGAPGSVTGGIKLSAVFILLKRQFLRVAGKAILVLVLFQFLSGAFILFMHPQLTVKEIFVLQFSAFFNVGAGGFDLSDSVLLFYLSVIMLAGRVTSLLLPWYFFAKIKSQNFQGKIIF